MLWEAGPSQQLAGTAHVPMSHEVLAQVTAASRSFSTVKVAPFLMLGSLFGWSGFIFPSQPARKAFPEAWQAYGHGGLVAHCRIKLCVP